MRQSKFFLKTSKTVPSQDVAANARLLEQGGFVYKNSAGIYTYLPLGWRVLQKIAKIIREEMNRVGGQELFMPALHDKHYLQTTGRWGVDVVYKVIEGGNTEPNFNISWTHEEIASEIASRFVESYRDLPFSLYQIQTKFRHEPRAKSGLLRGREFMMKDLYSFHADEEDFWQYYEEVAQAYLQIFKRCGLEAIYTLAAGGEFTANNTHEFQVVTEVGEDTIMVCGDCSYAENTEVSSLKEGENCPKCGGKVYAKKSVEVGNIFPLGTKYSEAFDLKYTDQAGQSKYVVMGSYGIGLGRLMGTVVEIFNDDKGIIWPDSLAPFDIHLVALYGKNEPKVRELAENTFTALSQEGFEVLFDDRQDKGPGEKFADSDLIGIPNRVVISEKRLETGLIELKNRRTGEVTEMKLGELKNKISQ